MEDHDHLVRQLISALRDDMSEAGRELKNRSAWDLQCPIVIIDARTNPHRIVRTSVRGITGAIATSNVIDDPLMRSFFERWAGTALADTTFAGTTLADTALANAS